MNSIKDQRKALIAVPYEEERYNLEKRISSHINKCVFLYTANGTEGMFKIENDAPDLIFIDPELPNTTIEKFVDWCFTEKNFENLAIIILSEIPEEELFVDEVVLGKIHYLPLKSNEQKLSEILSRALNYISRDLSQDFHLRFLAPGEELIHEGDNDNCVYILKSGILEAQIERQGNVRVLGEINPGEFVGEMAYINEEARSANVVAKSDAELIEIPSDRLDHMLFEKPAWSKALMKTLSQRLKRVIYKT